MSEWWIVQNTSVTPNTYTVVEKNPPAPAGAYNDLPYFNEASANSAAAQLNTSAKEGVTKTLASRLPGGSALLSVQQFMGNLANSNLWIRVGEAIAGLILLGIGLNAMLKGKPLQIVTSTAGIAGKAAMM